MSLKTSPESSQWKEIRQLDFTLGHSCVRSSFPCSLSLVKLSNMQGLLPLFSITTLAIQGQESFFLSEATTSLNEGKPKDSKQAKEDQDLSAPKSQIAINAIFSQGFSNVPWRKRAFGPGTKYGFLDLFLGILGALCTGKGAPLVRYLCTT